jgi:hypothetical protein
MDNSISVTLTQIEEVESRYEEEGKTTMTQTNTFLMDSEKSINAYNQIYKGIRDTKQVFKELTKNEFLNKEQDLIGSGIERGVDEMNEL